MKRASLLLLLFLSTAAFAKAQSLTGYTIIANVSGTTATDATCPDGNSCGYQVTAFDGSLESAPSNVVIALIPPTGSHSVTLTWTASPTSGVTYNVYRHVGPLAPTNLVKVVN